MYSCELLPLSNSHSFPDSPSGRVCLPTRDDDLQEPQMMPWTVPMTSRESLRMPPGCCQTWLPVESQCHQSPHNAFILVTHKYLRTPEPLWYLKCYWYQPCLPGYAPHCGSEVDLRDPYDLGMPPGGPQVLLTLESQGSLVSQSYS
jgi:hypothetical protein